MLNKYQCSQSTDGCDCQCHNVSTPRPDSFSLPPQDPGLSGYVGELAEDGIFDEKFYSIEGQDSQGSHWIQGKNEPLELSGENGRDLGDVKDFIRTHFISRQELKEKLASMKKTCIGPPKWMLSPQDKARNVALQDVEDLL